ncbi:phage head closure protein [Gellertiella hungarica]|uniref:SPP1 family predicted phage head-tail adaptor n=1 Tax=Gellertiella hungarica TaxID=1572859 RepID=A0A7W6J6Q4_9HYPH|nr:phage head closure protein [Gellertiella hungarica]MBB4065727.1 SPP1 family predicted phage head-tail adaptor [Gellertiella hungarica]
MAGATIDAGRFRHAVVLERPLSGADGAGGTIAGFAAEADLFALVEPGAAEPAEDTGFALPYRRMAVTIRFRPGVTAGSRFRLGDRLLDIEHAFDPDETGRYIRCLCREEGP